MSIHELSSLTARRPRSVQRIAPGVGRGVLLAAACIALHTPSWATGDFVEYPLQTLSDYLKLDQLPAKSVDQIVQETQKEAPEVAKPNFGAELMALGKKPGPEALAAVEKLLVAGRSYADNSLLSVLHDVRDLYAGPANAGESAEYLEWRIGQADRFGASLDNAAPTPPPDGPVPVNKELVADIERHLAKASPALKPHWIYLLGAVHYRAHEIAESQPFFEKVVKEFSKSPRAEFALYMAARCQLWKSRAETYDLDKPELVAAERPKGKKLWDEYFAKYPHGRLLGDALGWYGAFSYDGGDFGTALRCYVQQLELKDHPELAEPAKQMIERTLSHLAADPKDKALAEVAKFPAAAQALVYLIVNTAETDNYNGKLESIEQVRGWRKTLLPRLAAAISAQGKLYQDAVWKPRYLAMLAYAASGAGQHEQALKLLAKTEESDDLLMVRGVVLHRAKQPAEAAKTLQTLLAKYPKSPLARGARLRLALALTDDHRGGEAVLALHKLLPAPKDSAPPPEAPDAAAKPDDAKPDAAKEEEEVFEDDPELYHNQILYGIDLDQVQALIDTLLNFAPIEELAAAAQTPQLDPVLRLKLTEPIVQRLLAKEQFDEAKKFMTPAQFGLFAAGLQKLTAAAHEAKDPGAHAAACLKLGDAWAAARGKLLTYPLDTHEHLREVYRDFSSDANGRRVESAPFIGATGNYRLDLENRDELRHAFNWWLEASDAQPGTPQTAQALWKAMKAMPQIADVSRYTFERAVARKWGDTARKLYDRLRTEIPDSVEAKRYAVAWSFSLNLPKPAEGEYVAPYRQPAGTYFPADSLFGIEDTTGDYKETETLTGNINDLQRDIGGADVPRAQAKVEALRKQANRIATGFPELRWVNLLDDLSLFLAEPDPGADVRKRYAELRFRFTTKSAVGSGYYEDDAKDVDSVLQKDIRNALADPATKPVADYFEFLDLAVIANHFIFVELKEKEKDKNQEGLEKDEDTYRSRDYPLLAKQTEAFLKKYPHSKKREAALLLQARAVFRGSEQISLQKIVNWPRASRWEGGNEPTLTQQVPFEPKTVLAALDAYDREFPGGQYAADIRLYRATVAFRQHDWKTAIDLSIAQLDGQTSPALSGKAANRLGDVFAQLADERYRMDLLPVIKANKRARELFEKYLATESDTHPLLYLKGWLREQLAGR